MVYGGDLDAASRAAINRTQLHDHLTVIGRLEFDPLTGLSGRDQITRAMQLADYLLLLHGSTEVCAEYIPSKLYEYWWANRPIFSVIHQNSQLVNLVKEIHPQNIVVPEGDIENLVQALSLAWAGWESGEIANFKHARPPITPEHAVGIILEKLTENDRLTRS